MLSVKPPLAPLTIAYITARRDPKFRWWCDSLARETGGDYTGIRVVVIDFFAEALKHEDGWTADMAAVRREEFREACKCPDLVHSAPIWNPWQGPHRLTRENWFAKADYLNAAACLTPGEWMVSCDDLSVLMPGWLAAVREATERRGFVTCGAYRKVECLAVLRGNVVGFREREGGADIGVDPRFKHTNAEAPIRRCAGGWMFGCSFVAPMDAILKVNGWPQLSNGLGFEDTPTGAMIERVGYQFCYDRRMMTWESEEDHHTGKQMVRSDYGQSPEDKSHAFLAMMNAASRNENLFGPEGLAGVRQRVLAGEPLPVIREPLVEFFTQRRLQDL